MNVLSRTFLGDGSYITYPHMNAFAFDGKYLVFAKVADQKIEFWMRHLPTGKSSRLADFGPQQPGKSLIWYEVALHGDRLAIVYDNQAHIMDLQSPQYWRKVYEAAPAAQLDGLCSLSKDGTKLLLRESLGDTHRAFELDLTKGVLTNLFTVDWYANHFHYCPYDENWVAYSHEGPAEQIIDRCWVWHPKQASQGRLVFNQISPNPEGFRLSVGHERWAFHGASAYVPAYAVSPTGPRGLYEIFADGRSPRLLWESDVLWHCNMDLTGRFAVVDTTGPFREEMLTSQEFELYRNLHVETDRKRGSNASDVVLLDLQNHRFLPISTVERSRHPYHPHPAISPDHRHVIWNDSREDRRGGWVAEITSE